MAASPEPSTYIAGSPEPGNRSWPGSPESSQQSADAASVYRPPVRPMVELCEHLLHEIGKSLKVFKPSKSLAMLTSLSSESLRDKGSAEIDIVISGGGMKCYFMTGCHSILVQELSRRGVKIARVAGASAGAWSGMFMCTGMGTQTWLESYYGFRERQGLTMHEAYDDMVSGRRGCGSATRQWFL
jgi:hypothetical protein